MSSTVASCVTFLLAAAAVAATALFGAAGVMVATACLFLPIVGIWRAVNAPA